MLPSAQHPLAPRGPEPLPPDVPCLGPLAFLGCLSAVSLGRKRRLPETPEQEEWPPRSRSALRLSFQQQLC